MAAGDDTRKRFETKHNTLLALIRELKERASGSIEEIGDLRRLGDDAAAAVEGYVLAVDAERLAEQLETTLREGSFLQEAALRREARKRARGR